MQSVHLNVAGMTCGDCANKLALALKTVSGVSNVNVSVHEGKALIQFDERLTSPEQLKAAVQRAGYNVEPASAAAAPRDKHGCCD